MPALQSLIMQKLYGHNIWDGFEGYATTDLQGWNGENPSLERLAALPGDKIVVDVGVWKGQSTIHMALAMKNRGIDGCVIAIDTFLGSPEHWDMADLFSRQNSMPNLFLTFMSNVKNSGVEDYIIPLPQTSVTAAHVLRAKQIYPTIVHVDAAHEYQEVLRDCEEYFELLIPNGYLIGDDYDWPGVIRAAGEFSSKKVLPLRAEVNKWIIQKIV